MSKDYIQIFSRFFNNTGRMSSTYKPVFLRSLLDIGDLNNSKKAEKLVGNQWVEQRGEKILVNLNFIAIRFAKYYWDMEYSFHLRQSQDPQDANIIRLIKAVHNPEKKPPTIKKLSLENMDVFRTNVINKSIKPEVLIHLLTDMIGLYKKTDSKVISLDNDIIKFLSDHKIILKRSLNYVLVKYLEKLNRMTPSIANKIDNELKIRPQLKAEIQIKMNNLQNSKCFYCKKELHRYHVDHVIPFNYIFATDLYNCVLACQQCNCTKSDMLPEKDLFNNVIKRNRDILDYIKTSNTSYDEKSYIRLFETCASEYNRDKFFKPDI